MSLKVKLTSDLHLEFFRKNLYVPSFEGEDLFVLAGDVQVDFDKHAWFADLLEHRDVLYILGNHEAYHMDLSTVYDTFKMFGDEVNQIAEGRGFKHKLHTLQNETMDVGDVRFICATLWTDFNRGDKKVMDKAEWSLNDYRYIKNNGKKLLPSDIVQEHKFSASFIDREIDIAKDEGKKAFVVTHHLPSYTCVAEQYRSGNPNMILMNHLFYSDLDHIVSKADYWQFGHTHSSFNHMLGNCNLLCNPLGYEGHEINPDFKEMIVEIK